MESIDAVAILMQDHQEIKRLFESLLQADGATRPGLLDDLKRLLVLHNAAEENVVYPAIFELAQRPMHARGLYHEQDDAAVHFWDLSVTEPGDPEFLRKGSELLDTLLAHVRKEEETEFPHLRDALTPQAMQQLTGELQEFRQTFGAAVQRAR
jgi:hemerythrin superfamily protein